MYQIKKTMIAAGQGWSLVPMNQLVPDPKVNKFFEQDEAGQSLGIPVMTVGEFFAANHRITLGSERFICSNAGHRGFTFNSLAFKKIFKSLKEKGFTYEHWVMFLPIKGGWPDLSLLSKDQKLGLPFYQVCGLKPRGNSFKALAGILIEKVGEKERALTPEQKDDLESARMLDVTVGQLMNLTHQELRNIFIDDKLKKPRMLYYEMQGVIQTIGVAQRALGKLGFSYDDGRFMSLSFSRKSGNSPLRMLKAPQQAETSQQLNLFTLHDVL